MNSDSPLFWVTVAVFITQHSKKQMCYAVRKLYSKKALFSILAGAFIKYR